MTHHGKSNERERHDYYVGLVFLLSLVLFFTFLAIKYRPVKAPDIVMVFVPAGDFLMGSDKYVDEGPSHKVYVNAFYIDAYEVTNAQYKTCMNEGICPLIGLPSRFTDPKYANHPVIFVDWWTADLYCKWRQARLPTEAEWEKAASWDEKTQTKYTYPWGNKIDCSYANFSPLDSEYCVDDTSPVGSYPLGRSPYGMFDMAGNVEEWTSSLYLPYPYDARDGREDPFDLGNRVLRGGNNYSSSNEVSSTYRSFFRNNLGFEGIGFRCAKDAKPEL